MGLRYVCTRFRERNELRRGALIVLGDSGLRNRPFRFVRGTFLRLLSVGLHVQFRRTVTTRPPIAAFNYGVDGMWNRVTIISGVYVGYHYEGDFRVL